MTFKDEFRRLLFRDSLDADEKRKEITWIAILCIFVLAAWLFLAIYLGGAADFSPRSYEEKVLFGGLGAILLCSVLYIATREREQRLINKRLLADLRNAISQLDDRYRQLHSICFTSAELVGALDAEHICRLIVESLAGQLKTAECSLSFYSPRRGQLEFRARGSETHAQMSDQTSLPSNAPHEIAAPLLVQDMAVGNVTATRPAEASDFSPEERSLLATMANMAAKGLENARLHEELRESYFSTLRTLMGLVGARDNYTASHAQRTSDLACRLAEYIGLSDELRRLLEEYAPLHDLGKVGIPDDILLKTEPLSPGERRACEQHAVTGERLLRPLRPDPRALEMIRNHHERWDGKGYPDGLVGEQTPLLARLLHIADCYDAILSEKVYSAGTSPQQALAEICLGSGREFDPSLTEAFAALLREEGIVLPEGLTLALARQNKYIGTLQP